MNLREGFELLSTAPDGLARLRDLIFGLAVQGKLVPQDPKDEPAFVLLQRIRAERDALIAVGKVRRDSLRHGSTRIPRLLTCHRDGRGLDSADVF
ncbi:hypothetical protein AU476_01290 [Cupriavidus sp. UYMSc13B]|nr:hypothetical protein AU476_01290 [Cupriavidus sp. UYMSc13B]